MRYWAYRIEKSDKKTLALEGGFETEAEAQTAAEEMLKARFPENRGLEIRTFQPPYNPDLEKVVGPLTEMIADLIEKTQRLEEKYGKVIAYLNASGIEVGDPEFDTLNMIRDGEENVDLIVSELLLQDNSKKSE